VTAAVRPVAADGLLAAVLRTLAYADVFDFALREPELHRYLIGHAATPGEVAGALAGLGDAVVRCDGLVALPGRDALIEERQHRRRVAARTWPAALRYAQAVGSLPFVRMVAITGALAVGNATDGADIDLLVVTERGRVWLARASTIAIVRYAASEGQELCPNYFLAEHALTMDDRDLYAAHELTQMAPVTGFGVYQRLRAANPWTAAHLPNANGGPLHDRARRRPVLQRARPVAEAVLRSPLGGAVEAWEQRKIARFRAEAAARGVDREAGFTPDWCKGHLDGHGARIRVAYETRVRTLGLEPLW
jgi:hypothetical protein